jgi:hypothetical protein
VFSFAVSFLAMVTDYFCRELRGLLLLRRQSKKGTKAHYFVLP